jgi:endoglucanase
MTLKSLIIAALIPLSLCATDTTAETRFRGMTLSPQVTDRDLRDLARWHANVVRYQMVFPSADTADEAQYLAWVEETLTRLDQILTVCAERGMRVIIDLHTPPGGFASTQSPALHRLFQEAWAQDALVKTWERIATRYKDNQTVLGYDLVSEPAERSVATGLLNWNGLAAKTAAAIRAIDTAHTLFVEPIYGDAARLRRLQPLSDSNVVYSIHLYSPLRFHHQGINGRPINVRYPDARFNKNSLRRVLSRAVSFQKKHDAQIFVGEFTAVRWAPGRSAVNYLRDLLGFFESYGWDYTYHSFREFHGWSLEHDSNPDNLQRVRGRTDRAEVIRQFLARNQWGRRRY